MKRSFGENLGHAIIAAVLFIMALVCLYPFWHVFMYSLSDSQAAMGGGFFFFPRGFSVTQYKVLLRTSNMFRSFMVSLIRVLIGVPFNIIMTATLAYPIANRKLPCRGVISMLVFFTMIFSGGLIPSFLINRMLGLYNNPLVYLLPGAISAYNMMVMKSYFISLPDELSESAQLDGANVLTILIKIIIPVSIPVIAALAMFYGVGHWNSWFDGVIYIDSKKWQLFQVFLRGMMMESSYQNLAGISDISDLSSLTEESVKMAAISMSLVPILIAYPFIQRYYIKGLMIGAVKG